MDDRGSNGGWSEIDPGRGFRVDADLQMKLADCLLLLEGSTQARLAAKGVEEAIRAYKTNRSAPIEKERMAFRRIRLAAGELVTKFASLSSDARFALLTHFKNDGKFSISMIPQLGRLEEAASECLNEWHGSPKNERRGYEKDLVADLVEVFETYRSTDPTDRPRTGAKRGIISDRTAFVRLGLEAAGFARARDDDESLQKAYIKPALKYARAGKAELARRLKTDEVIVQSAVGKISVTGNPAIVWMSGVWAPDWIADARREAKDSASNADARRREILFAVCAAESYLIEWVRDYVLKRNLSALDRYFPPEARRPIAERWREVVEALETDRLIQATPDFGTKNWEDFKKLVEYRNGLVHGRASRPARNGQRKKEAPLPTRNVVRGLKAGWALSVVLALINDLHEASGTPKPEWLREP